MLLAVAKPLSFEPLVSPEVLVLRLRVHICVLLYLSSVKHVSVSLRQNLAASVYHPLQVYHPGQV